MLDLAIFVGGDEEYVTSMAIQLDACMLSDENAQARYQAIYGVAWEPLSAHQDRETSERMERSTLSTNVL